MQQPDIDVNRYLQMTIFGTFITQTIRHRKMFSFPTFDENRTSTFLQSSTFRLYFYHHHFNEITIPNKHNRPHDLLAEETNCNDNAYVFLVVLPATRILLCITTIFSWNAVRSEAVPHIFLPITIIQRSSGFPLVRPFACISQQTDVCQINRRKT